MAVALFAAMRLGWMIVLPLAGCVGADAPEDVPAVDGGQVSDVDADESETAPSLARCTGRAFTKPADEDWTDWDSAGTALAGDPRHYAQDVIAPPGEAATITAKFAYGSVWKDLEDERVRVFVDDCTGWQVVGTFVTDDDGVITFPVAGLGAGQHEVRAVVLGDGTEAVTSLWLLPRGTHVVITDVDGTMTTADTELFQELLDGDYVPTAYPDAQALTHAHVARGHVVIYLTGRPYWLLAITRGWLTNRGFAPGPVHVTDSNTDILPTEGSVGAFKTSWLEGLVAQGYEIDLAYGNATTDIYAYNNLGLESWIIGPHAGEAGTHAVTGAWSDRLREVEALPFVDQPF